MSESLTQFLIASFSDENLAGGAVAGGLPGSFVGFLRGSPIAGTGLGAVLGGVAAEAFDSGIPDAHLNQIAANLPNGSSVVARDSDAQGDDYWWATVVSPCIAPGRLSDAHI